MKILILYLIFIIVAMLIISYLVTKLDVKNPVGLIVGLCLLIISPIIIGYLFTTYIAAVPEVAVPSVTMLTTEEAKTKLEKVGLVGRVAEESFERRVPEGMVISQKPEAGRKVKLGRVVNLKISIGAKTVRVPNLVGRTFSQIEIVLNEAGLKVGTRKMEVSEEYQTGIVMSQDPLPDDEVRLGSAIDVTIAKNPKMSVILVPKLVYMDIESAKKALASENLGCIVFYHETKQFESGTVISQDPIDGTEISMGESVKIFVAVPSTKEVHSGEE